MARSRIKKDTKVLDRIARDFKRGIKEYSVGIHDKEVAEYGIAHEFGTEDIPQRSFISSTYNKERRSIEREMGKILRSYYKSKGKKDLGETISTPAENFAGEIINTIKLGINPPLMPETIKRKGSSKPLIDSGELIESIEDKEKQ